jgi:hypothetical protein
VFVWVFHRCEPCSSMVWFHTHCHLPWPIIAQATEPFCYFFNLPCNFPSPWLCYFYSVWNALFMSPSLLIKIPFILHSPATMNGIPATKSFLIPQIRLLACSLLPCHGISLLLNTGVKHVSFSKHCPQKQASETIHSPCSGNTELKFNGFIRSLQKEPHEKNQSIVFSIEK